MPESRRNKGRRTTQTQAGSANAEAGAGFAHSHVYDPIGWDRFDPKVQGGTPIQPGSKVRMVEKNISPPLKGQGSFNIVEDEHGNRQSVMSKSLKGKNHKYDTPAVFNDRRPKNPYNS